VSQRRNEGDGKALIQGLIGGAIAGGIVAGLLKVGATEQPNITSTREVIQPQTVSSTPTILKPDARYKFAIVLFHGDGDAWVRLSIRREALVYNLKGNEQAILLLGNEVFGVVVTDIEGATSGNTPTIEILSLSW